MGSRWRKKDLISLLTGALVGDAFGILMRAFLTYLFPEQNAKKTNLTFPLNFELKSQNRFLCVVGGFDGHFQAVVNVKNFFGGNLENIHFPLN